MAILKSLRLQQQEEIEKIRQENADACYAIIDGWEAKVGNKHSFLSRMSTEPPPGRVVPMDNKPFGHDHRGLPSRNARTFNRWSQY